MAIFDIFSLRKRRAEKPAPDVFQYEEIPDELRAQIVHILRDVLGDPSEYNSPTEDYYAMIHDALCREYGWLGFPNARSGQSSRTGIILNFIISESTTEQLLDVLELALRVAWNERNDWNYATHAKPKMKAGQAIEEINHRFRERGVGYRYESGEMIRVDSEFIHAEVIKPTLNLLQGNDYSGANEEFLKAHEHYRHRRYKEALNECLKALESTLKTICTRRGWDFDPNATASSLIATVLDHELIPRFLQSHFSGMRSTLEAGVPTIRNRTSGHGQGITPSPVPPHLASYALSLTAAAISLLVEADRA
jgi:hypothetical protein